MGLYRHHVFPWVLELVMNQRVFRKLRREVLSPAAGRVLEIGFGTGINLPYYPSGIHRVIGVDSNPGVSRLAARRASASHIEVEHHALSAEALPFGDAEFDTVVSTFTLCSIADFRRALAGMRRVLKPGGKLVFCEHGRAPDEGVRRWQDRLNPLWKTMSGGCNINRPVIESLEEAGFSIETSEAMYLPGTPRVAGFNAWGVAVPR